jgi:hypothetical protein
LAFSSQPIVPPNVGLIVPTIGFFFSYVGFCP